METVTKRIGIHFGALVDPLSVQLDAQGLKYEMKEVMHFQKDMEAIDRLRISGLLPEGAAEKVRKKLHQKIVSHVAKCEGLKVKK